MRRRLQALDAWLFGGVRQRVSFVVALLVFGGLAAELYVQPAFDRLDSEIWKEPALKNDYQKKLAFAVNLGPARKFKGALSQQAVDAQSKPSFVEISSLARRFGLQVEHLEAEETQVRAPLVVRSARARIGGSFTRFAEFAEAVAGSERAFALRNLEWTQTPAAPGLALEVTIDIARPMTQDEVADAKKAAQAAKEQKK